MPVETYGEDDFDRLLDMDARDVVEEYTSHCPACGEMIDYCLGHGQWADPEGYKTLMYHDFGNHSRCRKEGCEFADGSRN